MAMVGQEWHALPLLPQLAGQEWHHVATYIFMIFIKITQNTQNILSYNDTEHSN